MGEGKLVVGMLSQRIRKIAEAREELTAGVVDIPSDVREWTGYEPRPLQGQLHGAMRRFNVAVCHRRFGKTVAWINELIEAAVENHWPNPRYAYLAPTYSQAEDIAWTYLLDFTEKFEPHRKVEVSRLAVWIPTRHGSMARIRLYGVDSPKQRLRGLYLDGAVFDEPAQMPPSVWTQQVRPMLSDDVRAGVDATGRRNQWATFIGTPAGRNFFHDLYSRASIWQRGDAVELTDEDGVTTKVMSDEWAAFMFKASETGILTVPELRAAKIDMEDDEYEQEYECSFDAAVRGAIFAKQIDKIRNKGQVTRVPWLPEYPVHTAWDLGFDDATAIWFFQILGQEIRVIDYFEASGRGLEFYADTLAEKDYMYGKHYLPHDVEVTDLGTGKSRRSVLQELGVRVTTVPRVPKKDDSIAAGRKIIPRCWFDEAACAEGLDRLALYRREWNEKTLTFRNQPLHDWTSHAADAWQTLAMGVRFDPPEGGGFNSKGTGRAEL